MKKFDVRRRSCTRNFCNTAVCVSNVNVCYSHSHFAPHNRNFNVVVQHVSVSSCSRPRSSLCFHNRISGVKSSKTIRDLTFRKVAITDFNSDSTSKPIKSLLFW